MDFLVEYYRLVSGEHPDWDDYRAGARGPPVPDPDRDRNGPARTSAASPAGPRPPWRSRRPRKTELSSAHRRPLAPSSGCRARCQVRCRIRQSQVPGLQCRAHSVSATPRAHGSPSRKGRLWQNDSPRVALARPEFALQQLCCSWQVWPVLLTDDLAREHDRQRREWRPFRTGCRYVPIPADLMCGKRTARMPWPAGLFRLIRAVGELLQMSAPGRSRTDTGDPFRGPAFSLGLRGLGNNTPERLSDSRAAELIQNVSPGGVIYFHLDAECKA